MLLTLGEQKILSLNDFADLTSDELIGGFDIIKGERIKIKGYVEIENLMNKQVPRRVNPFTGDGYEPGEIYGYYLINRPNPNQDPSRYNKPRSMEIGFQFIF